MNATLTDGATRRRALGAIGAAAVLAACGGASQQGAGPGGAHKKEEVDVGPAEDLMREHGVLRRVMFLYDDAAHRLDGSEAVPADALVAAAGIIRRVIEDYHEKLEEQHVFPVLERARKLTDLVATLRAQHLAGRRVTEALVAAAKGPLQDDADRRRLAAALRSFNRMYRPHAAREDTILFPVFHEIVGDHAYKELGEQFEDIETKTLGEQGFEHAVAEVERLEIAFGLQDLAKFTPS